MFQKDKDEKEIATIGIVDVKEIGKDKYYFTTTNEAPLNCTIRLIVDNKLEEENSKIKRKLPLDATFRAIVGHRAELELSCSGKSFKLYGDIVEKAENQPLTREECMAQLSKCGEDFELKNLTCITQNAFLRKAQLNALRRDCLQGLMEKLCENFNKNIEENEFLPNFSQKNAFSNKNIVIFYEKDKLLQNCDRDDYLVYSPSIFDKNEIIDICKKVGKVVYLDCPIMGEEREVKLIRELVQTCDNLGIYASNYYALNLCAPEKTIISSELNVVNNYSLAFYSSLGFNKVVLSKENFDFGNISFDGELFRENIAPRLIYFSHCPIKEHFNCDCNNCKYHQNIVYYFGNNKLTLCRRKIIKCQFYLKGEAEKKQGKGFVIEDI